MGKPGSGRASMLKTVLSDDEFVQKYKINRFVYGTTREITVDDIVGETYFFFTEKEFRELEPSSIIESRSHDLITSNNPVYYFTLKEHIKFNTNYIGKVSLYQYEELKKWATMYELKYPNIQISLYLITLRCNAFECFERLKNKSSSEDDLYTLCARMVSEKFEYDAVIKNNKEVLDANCFTSLVLDNAKHDSNMIKYLSNDIKQFMAVHILLQEAH